MPNSYRVDYEKKELQYFKGGPSDLATKNFQNTRKIILILSKPFDFYS